MLILRTTNGFHFPQICSGELQMGPFLFYTQFNNGSVHQLCLLNENIILNVLMFTFDRVDIVLQTINAEDEGYTGFVFLFHPVTKHVQMDWTDPGVSDERKTAILNTLTTVCSGQA